MGFILSAFIFLKETIQNMSEAFLSIGIED